jgi:hypothetical protein
MGRWVKIPWIRGIDIPTMGVKIPNDTGPFFIHDPSPDL